MAVRVLAWLTPILASTTLVFIASRLVTRPRHPGPSVLWWAGLLALGTLTMLGTERIARRLLPLAALLKLSLAFPDAAPSRFGVVLRSGSLRRLEQRQQQIADEPMSATPAEVTAELARLVARLHNHDRRTRGHAERVRAYAVLLGQELKLAPEDLDRLQWAALLHDIGKITVPAEILNKASKLTDDEFEIIKSHPGEGAKLIEPLRWWLQEWADGAGQHHEKFDGSGYPLRLAGTGISYAGRIVAVADAYDVMTAARSYKKPLDATVARKELTRCAGTHFDPVVVRAFLSISIGRLERTTGPLTWLANIPVIGTAPLVNAAAAVAVGTVAVLVPHDPATLIQPAQVSELSAPIDVSSSSTVVAATATPTGETAAVATTGPAPVERTATDPTSTTDSTRTTTEGPTTTVAAPTTTTPASTTTEGPTTTVAAPTTAPPTTAALPTSYTLPPLSVGRNSSKQLSVLGTVSAQSLLYLSCDEGTFSFAGNGDPLTISPKGATASYFCEFQADRSNGTTVSGSFRVDPV